MKLSEECEVRKRRMRSCEMKDAKLGNERDGRKRRLRLRSEECGIEKRKNVKLKNEEREAEERRKKVK